MTLFYKIKTIFRTAKSSVRWLSRTAVLFFILIYFSLLTLQAKAFYEEEFPVSSPEHKEELPYYIENFCKNKGRSFVRIQNNHVVDCMTADTLWKVDYSSNWPQALTKALALPIYDDYSGDDKFAPVAGVVLVQENADDFKGMIELKHLVVHYKLPLRLEIIENYSKSSESIKPKKFLKRFQIDFDN